MFPELALGVALLILAGLLILLERGQQALPRGTVVYSDVDGRGQVLRSPLRPLSGKPDYVLRPRRGGQIPVECKSYRCGDRPPHADIVQLGAYLLLLEDLSGQQPPYGVLRYTDRVVRVPYTPALREEICRLLQAVAEAGDEPPPAAPHPSLCCACPFAPICESASSIAGVRVRGGGRGEHY